MDLTVEIVKLATALLALLKVVVGSEKRRALGVN